MKDLQFKCKWLIERLFSPVGAGTSGAVLASRLVEDSDRDILVLEAGGDPIQNPNIDIPLMADSVRGTDFDWQYKTTPQQHACLGNIDKVTRCSSLS